MPCLLGPTLAEQLTTEKSEEDKLTDRQLSQLYHFKEFVQVFRYWAKKRNNFKIIDIKNYLFAV